MKQARERIVIHECGNIYTTPKRTTSPNSSAHNSSSATTAPKSRNSRNFDHSSQGASHLPHPKQNLRISDLCSSSSAFEHDGNSPRNAQVNSIRSGRQFLPSMRDTCSGIGNIPFHRFACHNTEGAICWMLVPAFEKGES